MINRSLLPLAVLVGAAAAVLLGCGAASSESAETLPEMVTTTSTTTTTTTPDTRRIFYEVARGDNLSEIARRYQVPREEIVKLNRMSDGGQYLEIGQVIEIPNDMRLDDTLPPLPDSSSSTAAP